MTPESSDFRRHVIDAVAHQVLVTSLTDDDCQPFPFIENILIEAIGRTGESNGESIIILFRDVRAPSQRFGHRMAWRAIETVGIDDPTLEGAARVNTAAMIFLANLERPLTLDEHLGLVDDSPDPSRIVWVN